MKVAIQQPHYFPWLGYFDKMAKVDLFVFLDEVQIQKSSQMIRNRILNPNGEPAYITIMADKKGHREKKYSEIMTINNSEWKETHLRLIKEYYRNSSHLKEVYGLLEKFFVNDYDTVCRWTIQSILLINELLGINTQTVLQSSLSYDRESKKSDLMLTISKSAGAETYLAGRGASVQYLDRDSFSDNHICIEFQDFDHPKYEQINTDGFIPGLSILDMLLNCGIERTRRIFWDNIKNGREKQNNDKQSLQ